MDGEETPWALVQRLRGEGASFDAIIVGLQARGLPRDDIEILLKDDEGFRAWSRGQAPVQAASAPVQVSASAPSTPTDGGRIGRWAAITVSALACGLLAATAKMGIEFALMFVAVIPALWLLIGEFKKGVRRTSKALGYVLFFSFFAPALSGFIGGWGLAQLLTTPLFLLSVPMMIWASRTGEKLKGLPDFGDASIFENGEVQFAVSYSAAQVGPGETVDVVVHAQNCVDVARSLRIMVRGDMRSNLATAEHALSIEPGCVIEVMVPVRVPPLAPERFGFTIDFVGSGTNVGRRVRLAKGAEWVTPAASLAGNLLGVATLATAGLGVFTLGSNGGITVKVDTEKPYATSERKFETKELYRPDAAALSAAATS